MLCTPEREPPIVLKETQDPNVIANRFNNYFCSIESNLTDSIFCIAGEQPKQFLEKKLSDSIYLEPPTNREIFNQITSSKNEAVGHDNIQPFSVKGARFVVAPYILTYFSATYLLKVFFPCNCKIARVVPIYKIGEKDDINKSRPISLLTFFQKLLKNSVCTTQQIPQQTQCNLRKSIWISKLHFYSACNAGCCRRLLR